MKSRLSNELTDLAKKIYALRRMRRAIYRGIIATSIVEKIRAEQWVHAWGCVAGVDAREGGRGKTLNNQVLRIAREEEAVNRAKPGAG